MTQSIGNEPGAAGRVFAESVDEIPAVKPTEQKGVGLVTLRKSLELFEYKGVDLLAGRRTADGDLSAEERQRLLEVNTFDAAMVRWRQDHEKLKGIGVNSKLASTPIGSMMWKWHEALIPLMEQEAGRAKEAEERKISERADDDVLLWGPYLQTLAPEKLSAVTIMAAMNCITTELPERDRGTPIATIVHSIGKAVEAESSAEIFARKRRDKNWRKSYLAQRAKDVVSSGSDLRSQGQLQKILRVQKSWIYERLQWTPTVKIRIGALLLSHLLDIAKVQVSRQDPKTGTELQEMQPVFFHTFHFSAGRRVGVVRLNTAVLESLSKGPVTSAIAKFLPMVAEPKPWVGYREGGFYEHSVSVIRLTSHDHQSRRYAITAAENGDLSQVFAALDVLGKTQWRINSFVFKVMLDGWNSEEAIAKIPPANPPSEKFEEPPPSAENGMRRKWLKDIREAENRRTGLKCQRCFQNFQLEIARAYLNETFYFPHNCDFRGRAYPMTPFFNHMGSDNMRGLLLFAQGKELTDSGLSWLKIHLANMYGYDKASFDERVQFTESHLPEIYDSVKEPLKGKRWWLSAEDPWQCLAACNELKAALDLPDPTRYVCQLAIHQDGTCNGLQHYAALGGDVAGAQQVNLEPGHRPSDIYTAVAEMIKAEIANEAAQGSALAQQLDGKVTRKVVKQTVMTNVYGVTFLGAVRQVFKQLVDMKASLPAWSTLTVQAAAPYIARKIFKCLSTMFNGAHDTQYWLTDCATRITDSISPEQADHIEREAKCETSPTKFKLKAVQGRKDELLSFRSSVVWTTPLKMPAVQPYRKPVKCRVLTNLQSITIEKRTIADPIHRAKQIQAFPPNFIHSLDATHMFLTALKCHEIGISFASIHDCFWTHPADVNTMNRIIRDAFIRMHSEDIVGRLAAEFKARYKGYMYLAKVYSRTPVARKILKWRRDVDPAKNGDVKARQRQELILERHRLALLASEDPREREQGEAMVTPATILAEAADEKALAPSDIKPATIGGMGPASSRSVKLNANQGLDVGDIANVRTVLSNDESKDLELDSTAKSGADADEMETPEETTLDIKEDDPLTEQTEPREKKALTRNRQDRHKTWVWMPLAFPPVPKKVYCWVRACAVLLRFKPLLINEQGDFDISRLKNSQYFFS